MLASGASRSSVLVLSRYAHWALSSGCTASGDVPRKTELRKSLSQPHRNSCLSSFPTSYPRARFDKPPGQRLLYAGETHLLQPAHSGKIESSYGHLRTNRRTRASVFAADL